jgi:hypothetical protein
MGFSADGHPVNVQKMKAGMESAKHIASAMNRLKKLAEVVKAFTVQYL